MIARYFSWDTFNLVNVFYIWWSTHFKSTEYFFFVHFPASAGNHLYQFVFPGTINLMNFPSVFWRSNVFLWLVFKIRFTGTKMSKLWKFELFWDETITFSVPFLLKFSVKNKEYECFYASHSDLLKTYCDSLMRNPFFSSNFENCLEEHTAQESNRMWLLLCLCSRAWEALSVCVAWEPQAIPCLFTLGRRVMENVVVISGLVYFMAICYFMTVSILVTEILGISLIWYGLTLWNLNLWNSYCR